MKSIFKEIAIMKIPHFVLYQEWDNYRAGKVNIEQIENSRTVYETDLELPLMNVKDKFYIGEQDKFVTILDVIRSDSAYIYIVNRNIKEDDDALKKYNEDKKAYLERKEINIENCELRKKIENFEDSKYYQKYLKSKC